MIVAKCTVCGRGYVAVYATHPKCLDSTCPGMVVMLDTPIDEQQWQEPSQKEREQRKAATAAEDFER